MPQSPKQRLSPAQEGLIKKKTWGVSLCQTAAPAAGHEGTGSAPFPPAARRAWWAGGGSGCKEEQQSTGVNGWHTRTRLRISGRFGCSCYQTAKSSVKGQMSRLCGTDVFQMAHPHQKCTSGIASLWSLKTTNGVQSSELLCASNGSWQEKPQHTTHPEGKKWDPSLLTLIQATRWHFHLSIFRKIFRR